MIKVTGQGIRVLDELFMNYDIRPLPKFQEWPLGYARAVSSFIRNVMESPDSPPLPIDELKVLLEAAGVWDDPSTLPEEDLA